MRHRSIIRRPAHQQGFSLMEVLVSIVVLSFGLLGMVGMQAAALQSNREAKLQSLAAGYAKELAEMMRGNSEVGIFTNRERNPYLTDTSDEDVKPTDGLPRVRNGDDCYTFVGGRGSCEPGGDRLTRGAPPSRDATISCVGSFAAIPTPCRIARWEKNNWLDRIERDLPGSRVEVCFDETPYDANGRPRWACTETGTTAVIKIGWTRRSTNKSNTLDTPSNPASSAFERVITPNLLDAAPPSMVVAVTPGRANP